MLSTLWNRSQKFATASTLGSIFPGLRRGSHGRRRSSTHEREAEYLADIERRMSLVMDGPDTRFYASMKARNLPRDDGPLFGGTSNDPVPSGRQMYMVFLWMN
jgi:hypothetical protein